MELIDKKIRELVNSLDYGVASDMFHQISSGKKLRSKLILKIAGETPQSIMICAIVELIHLASLLHDDVIDDSSLRRGKPSINSLFGTKNAIMLGDILYSKAFNEIVKFDIKLADIISEAVCNLSIGEMMDVTLSSQFNADMDKYLRMIYLKTAALIEAAARCGALLVNLDDTPYANYGKKLGLAFQIIDDVLDIVSEQKTLGKPVMSDFKEGKTTVPYILLHSRLNSADRQKLTSMFKKELNFDEISWLKNKFHEYRVIEDSIKFAKDFGNEAIGSIDNKELQDIAVSMINRDF